MDGWIAEAKQLRQDLADSHKQETEMGQLAAQQQELEKASVDANYTVDFLKRELGFNSKLTHTLEKIVELRDTVDAAQEALIDGDFREAIVHILDAEARLAGLEGCQRTGLINLVRGKIADIRENLTIAVLARWSRLVAVEHDKHEIAVKGRDGPDPKGSIENTIFVLDRLDLLGDRLQQLKKDAYALVLRPRIGKSMGSATRSLDISGIYIKTTDLRPPASLERMLADVSAVFNYFSLVMPSDIGLRVVQILAPSGIEQLIAGPLASSIPPDLSGIASFASTLSLVQNFATTLGKRKWPGGPELLQWVDSAPRLWLRHRSNATLSSIRQLLSRGIGKPRSVERVETEQVPIEDETFAENGQPKEQDDWDNSWAEDETDNTKTAAKAEPKEQVEADADYDEEGAWGFDDEDEDASDDKPATEQDANNANGAEDDEEEDKTNEDWGWGDDGEQASAPAIMSPKATRGSQAASGQAAGRPPPGTSREVTLRETYHITAIPEQILEILVQIVDDAESLTSAPSSTYGPIQPAGEGLYALPSLTLSMFRACAPNAYTQDASGNMYLYNDSLYLAEQLRAFSAHQARKHSAGTSAGAAAAPPPLGIDADISALDTFGKASYGKEMEAQRTIVRDLLDGAQGFAHCTTAPHAEWCDTAVRSTTEWLATLHAQWAGVLAPSALHQSLGSLLGTAINQILIHVQDLSDISEPESKKLAGLCQRVEELNRLFLPDADVEDIEESEVTKRVGGGLDIEGLESSEDSAAKQEQRAARAAMAASVYTPGLLKFQWLSQILEGSLADIRFWWTESELALAYQPDEVVDLIEALFADSEYRRKAIAEIRRAR